MYSIPFCVSEEDIKEAEVKKAPEFSVELEEVRTFDGGEAKMECRLTGVPKPTVTWYKEDEIIYSTEEFRVSFEDDVCSLFIPDVYPEDSGKYTVVAKNEFGTASSSAELFVSGKIDYQIIGNIGK